MSDLISRQAAIDALGEAPEVWTDSPEEFAALSQWEMDVAAIKAVPSATCDDCIWHVCNYNKFDWDVRPKTGEWIDAEIPLESGGAMPIQVCNLCNTFYPLAHTGGGYHFCPHCGAKMVREDGEA